MSFDDKSQSYLEKGYALGRGYAPSLRLNLQHRLLRELLGYEIHPSILSSHKLPKKPKIADIGAGTGQWLIDVNRLLPSAHLDGFDISKDQYPNNAWLPAQISLQELDIMKPIPFSLQNQYDIVHVQLFLCVVQRDGPEHVLKQLYKLLSMSSPEALSLSERSRRISSVGYHFRLLIKYNEEPGGYLQWVEYDPMSFRVVSPDLSLKQTANERHVEIVRGPQGSTTESV